MVRPECKISPKVRLSKSCKNRRFLSAKTVEFCKTRRVLQEPSRSSARTVEFCKNRRVLQDPSSSARTVELCKNRRVLQEPLSLVTTKNSAVAKNIIYYPHKSD